GINGTFEKDINLLFAKIMRSVLSSSNIKVKLTRTDDRYLYLRERTNFAEKLKADLEKTENLIKTINLEISLKEDQIERYEAALKENVYSFVQLSQRKDELLKLQKQKILTLPPFLAPKMRPSREGPKTIVPLQFSKI
ncbi:MAG: N-acetylmuramoyl-L-alanine amidase, partial [SAR324 cluster bacterium]|nr:N-acetylmuramoyl-L-alanine amidase [SAR324 cluster bacterium]